ncbi:MAG TPA: saccharopine dehydrogenase C-terminal domain-containing protein [Limnochordales bacterium]|nr:saccharopine dehydrogenase C-terminal domain-containing protein [Limnochordales bacterium]
MRIAVLGTGLIGRMMVRELARASTFSEVLAVDGSAQAAAQAAALAQEAASETPDPPVVRSVTEDLSSYDAMVALLRDVDIAIAALPDSLSFLANQAAVKAGCHLIDLVGAEYPEKAAALHEPARKAGVLILTGCGVAPGIANVLAARGIELLDEADEVTIYCGGLPRHPEPPLMYQQVFSMEGLMGLYTRPVFIVENGRMRELPPMSGLEECRFPEPVGECEAAYSDAHSAPYTLGPKVKRLAEKTVRYRGHFSKMMVLQELGFLDDRPVSVDGHAVSPRQLTMALLEPRIQGKSKEDVTVMRVVAAGKKDGVPVRHEWMMMDFYDAQTGYTSMARTTGYPPIIVAQWLAQGQLPERGFFAPEQLLAGDRFEPFLAALAQRGITFEHKSETAAA